LGKDRKIERKDLKGRNHNAIKATPGKAFCRGWDWQNL